MNKGQITMQIGKNGLNKGLFELLKNAFKTREDVKISILKSAGHDREKIKEMAEEIVEKLGRNYTYRIVGFTIFIKKWKKAKR